MREWDTEKETLASRGNGQYEPYLVVSKDEADERIAVLEAEIRRLREDQRMLEWLVKSEAAVYWVDDCHYAVAFDGEDSRPRPDWREAINEAMQKGE
jgi:uncharacterized small protein (DUF1192 family)